MNQDRPSPGESEDVPPAQLAQIEQRLKRLRPRPVELDVEAIRRAAREVDQEVLLADHGERDWNRRSSSWITIGASWVCGAIAGGLLTFILLSREVTPQTESDRMTRGSEAASDATAAGEDAGRDGGGEGAWSDDSQNDAPRWSRSELLVSAQLQELYRFPLPSSEGSPLRAGNYLRLGATSGSPPARRSTVPRTADETDSSAPDRLPPGDDLEPSPAITRERLLQELLGVRPDSLL